MRPLVAITLAGAAGFASAVASASAVSSGLVATRGSVTPAGVQAQARNFLTQLGSPDLALFPTKLPAHFLYESFSVTGSPTGLDVSFADSRFIADPTQTRLHEISFDTAYTSAKAGGCAKKALHTLHLSGSLVYTGHAIVWRCVRTSLGHIVRESATGGAPESALETLILSAH